MVFTILDWHKRYQHQAEWTSALRDYIYIEKEIKPNNAILDLGCGTGALLSELKTRFGNHVIGLDLSYDALFFTNKNQSFSKLVQGDGHFLPFSRGSFDITLCHFLLLWVKSPHDCIYEMKRVTKSGGWVLALAEPDHGGRIDYPPQFSAIANWQYESLTIQGADPIIGRKLMDLYVNAGLINVEVGVLGGQWKTNFNRETWLSEWDVLEQDINFLKNKPDAETFETFKSRDLKAWQLGKRLIYVPTFYAVGQVK